MTAKQDLSAHVALVTAARAASVPQLRSALAS